MSAPLYLDFQQTRRVSRAGQALLGIGVAATLMLLGYFTEVERRLDEHDIAHAAAELTAPAPATSGLPTAVASEPMPRSPWGAVFSAIESSAIGNVALLSIVPDPSANLVNISGEAKNFAALWQYLRQLQSAPPFVQAHLTEHTIEEKDPYKPVRFSIVAQWSAQP